MSFSVPKLSVLKTTQILPKIVLISLRVDLELKNTKKNKSWNHTIEGSLEKMKLMVRGGWLAGALLGTGPCSPCWEEENTGGWWRWSGRRQPKSGVACRTKSLESLNLHRFPIFLAHNFTKPTQIDSCTSQWLSGGIITRKLSKKRKNWRREMVMMMARAWEN